MKDELIIDYKSNKICFELSYGYLDKIYEAFDIKTEKKESVEKFILSLADESFENNNYIILEDIEAYSDKLNIELFLDGLKYTGKGKISKFFSKSGINIGLLLNEEE